MNSLGYLSRQLDSSSKLNLQSGRTGHHRAATDGDRPQLARSKTWSKPFFFRKRLRKPIFTVQDSDEDSDESGVTARHASNATTSRQKTRSLSSPALFYEHNNKVGEKNANEASHPMVLVVNGKNNPPIPNNTHIDPFSVPSTPPAFIRKDSYLYTHFRNTYLIRALIAIWNCICYTYDRLLSPRASLKRVRVRAAAGVLSSSEEEVETTTTADERDTDEDGGGPVMMNPVTRATVKNKDRSLLRPLELVAPSTSTPPRRSSPPPDIQLTPAPSPYSTPSRTPPPALRRQTPFHLPKTLVLDLDETLIHSTSRPMYRASGSSLFGFEFGGKRVGKGHPIEVVLNGRRTLYHVYKRPFVDYFLRKVSSWYTLVIFTASMQEYADPVIDWLDAGKGVLAHRFFRDSCTQLPSGSYTKDLSLVEDDLSRVCLVDNSPICYSVNPANGIPIEGWTHDLNDEALLDLLPVLDSLRFTSDVRRVLGLRGFN